MKYKHTITITLDSEKQISNKAEGDLTLALQAQLEGLSEDHGIFYQNAEISTSLNIVDISKNQ